MHKILLVDDTRNFLDLEVSFLQRAECKILTATTGLDAVRIAKAERPDLILLDIEMPEMNGIQACRILKADPGTRGIPIIMLTSMQMESEARRAGAEHFMRKPIDEHRFLAEVKRFLPIRERAESRVVLDVPVTFWLDGEPGSGRLTNLSRAGIFVASEGVQPVGARLDVSFTLPKGKAVESPVMVVWTADEPVKGFGASFFQAPASARAAIEQFLDRAEPRQGAG